MAIIKEIQHLFNPDRKLSDFPAKVIATVSDDRVTKQYHVTSKGVLLDPVTEREYSLFDEGKYFCFYYRDNRPRSLYLRADEVMVYSFYKGMYGQQELMDVVHHDRFSKNLSIETLVPIFSLEQLQSYFIWRLSNLCESRFLVAQSTRPEQYTMSNYLVGEHGVVFGLDSKIFLSPKKGSNVYACLSMVVDLVGGGKATMNMKEHWIVAATFLEGMGPGKEVHHLDGNPRNNAAKNLVWLTRKEHMQIHHGSSHQHERPEPRAVSLYTVCATCIQELSPLTVCSCKYSFCSNHLNDHQTLCYYHEVKDDPEFNEFVPLQTDKDRDYSRYVINKNSVIKKKEGERILTESWIEEYASVSLYDIKTKKNYLERVSRLMASTFLLQDRINSDLNVVDHINANRKLNHVKNLRWVTARQNVVAGSGVSVIVEAKDTKEILVYDTIVDCGESFSNLYPNIRDMLNRADSVVEMRNHTFYREPKKTRTSKGFYLDVWS